MSVYEERNEGTPDRICRKFAPFTKYYAISDGDLTIYMLTDTLSAKAGSRKLDVLKIILARYRLPLASGRKR